MKQVSFTGALASVIWLTSWAMAHAGPRDDLRGAYQSALQQYNDLSLDQAGATLDSALSQAQSSGLGTDIALAPLLVLRAGIIHAQTNDKQKTVAAMEEAVRIDYNVVLPIELRSSELQAMLDEARKRSGGSPGEPVQHTTPQPECLGDLQFEVVVALPAEGGQVALYWRKEGEGTFERSLSMDLFGNLATASLPLSDHSGADLEYFVVVFDNNNQPLAGKGDQEAPLSIAQGCKSKKLREAGGKDADKKERKKRGPVAFPRVFIHLGLGTGVGVAHGEVEQTFQQYNPNKQYGLREAACAIARLWAAGPGEYGDPLPKPIAFAGHLNQLEDFSPGATTPLPGSKDMLLAAYNQGYCSRQHGVKAGMAPAPFHFKPEIGIRVGRALVLSLYSRLQVVSGSKVLRDDPTVKDPEVVYQRYVLDADPEGVRQRPLFPTIGWSIGVKARYFFGKDTKKFRLFAGGFAGYGFARLRVPLPFANDRNGNSVPDNYEAASLRTSTGCQPVWPYNHACGDQGDQATLDDQALAASVRANGKKAENRIDTVLLGPGMIGGTFGFHYQIVKYFGLFGELDVGVWFPAPATVLFDLTVGPVITF